MRINNHLILVEIDKEKQRQKQEKVGSIFLPPQYIHLAYNLQYGRIIQIGKVAAQHFPDAEVGDTAYFHHFIESQEWRLIDKLENGNELRLIDIVNNPRELFGVKKTYGTIIAHPKWVFLDKILKGHREIPKTSLLLVADRGWESESVIRQKIAELDHQMLPLQESFQCATTVDQMDEIYGAMENINAEKGELTAFLNKMKLCEAKILFIHKSMSDKISLYQGNKILISQNILYPLQIEDQQYLLTPAEQIDGKLN